MRGNVEINGIKMTQAQLVELFLATKDNLESMKKLCDAQKEEIEALESELRVKEDLFKIKNAISGKSINLNDVIKVKLTPLGADIYYHQYDQLNKDYQRVVIEPHLPKVDEKGYTKFQLHQFMELYGEHIGIAKPNVIEPLDIILCD
jgi:hypothetical protein